jgi:signal transduction histidine kinase/HAMP domain-containing protein
VLRDQQSGEHPGPLRRLSRLRALNIRSKIVLPYLVLTFVVMVIGTYVVTGLVAGSLDERLTNHLLETGRIVSDSLVQRELEHLESARLVAYTRGLAEALRAHDRDTVTTLGRPAAIGLGVESILVTDGSGQEMLHLLQEPDGSFSAVEGQLEASGLWMVQTLLDASDPDAQPKRGVGLHPINQRYYYFTAIPVPLENEMVGVVMVGTSLDTLMPYFQDTSLAHVTIYLDGGRAVATTFALNEEPAIVDGLLDELSIPLDLYETILRSDNIITGENVRFRGRWYCLARAPLRVSDHRLGVFAVALPSDFIISSGAASRDLYALLFAIAMGCVLLVGYLIARRITNPLSILVRTSRAVAEGDLEMRTGVRSEDEIGVLASTFDAMTGRLAERTQALQELLQKHREAASRIRSILYSIGDGVLLEDLEGNLIPLNAAAEAMLEEMSASFMLGPLREMSVGEIDHIEDLPSNPWLVERRRFQVGRRVLSARSAEVLTDDGERLGTVIVFRDVTLEVEAERIKDAFVAHVSHELRTPLTAIQGYTRLLLSGAGGTLDEEQRDFISTIDRHSDNLVAMINSLLDFSEMEVEGRLGLRRQPVELSTLVRKVAAEWRPQMEEKGVVLQVEAPADLPRVDADARRLHWALVNLVRNAWQYTPSGGRVTLRLSMHDGRVLLDVIDTGVGISSPDQQRLFSRFYRGAHGADDNVRGLGLGLYVTRVIVEAHGGEIRVASREGGGSTFTVVLPAMRVSGDGGHAA